MKLIVGIFLPLLSASTIKVDRLNQIEVKPEAEKIPFSVNDLYSGDFSYSTKNSVRWRDRFSYYFRGSCAGTYGICLRQFQASDTYRGSWDDGHAYDDQILFEDQNIVDNLHNYNGWEVSSNFHDPAETLQLVAYFENYEKNWRHSGFFDVIVYDMKDNSKPVFRANHVRYFKFRPVPRDYEKENFNWNENISSNTFVIVDDSNNIRVIDDNTLNGDSPIYLTNDGSPENIFNGVPDWVYEEEGVQSDNAIYWSPNGENLAFVKFLDQNVEFMEYMTYGGFNDGQETAGINETDAYSRMKKYRYPKPGTSQTEIQVCFSNFDDPEDGEETEVVCVDPPMDDAVLNPYLGQAEFEGVTDKLTFARMNWLDEKYAIIQWMSRISNSIVYYLYADGDLVMRIDESARTSKGWIQHSDPVIYQYGEGQFLFYAIESDSHDFKNLFEYDIDASLENQTPKIAKTQLSVMKKKEGHTDDNPQYRALVALKGYHEPSNRVWFQAAAEDSRDRHLYSVPGKLSADNQKEYLKDPWCITCDNWSDWSEMEQGNRGSLSIEAKYGPNAGNPRATCRYADVSAQTSNFFAGLYHIGKEPVVTATCYGPDVPSSIATRLCDCGRRLLLAEENEYRAIVADNYKLEQNYYETRLTPTREFGLWKSQKTEYTFQYEIWSPPHFDASKQYKTVIAVYAGPGSQAVLSRWSLDVSDHVMTTSSNTVVMRVDTRGTGNQGDKLMFEVYKIVGQLEKVDVTNFINEFEHENAWVDPDNLGLWGWSFGGYTTTHTALSAYGADTFKCAVAVAPLTARLYYDTLWSEITMDLPKVNNDNYLKGEPWNTELEAANNIKYTVIHGTGDDNVHFQNSARLNKELIAGGVEFNAYFYSDEAHSINYGDNAKIHVYKLVTRKLDECFDQNML